jgi:hypothetical protein
LMVSRNSQRFSSRQASAKGSRNALSSNGIPAKTNREDVDRQPREYLVARG